MAASMGRLVTGAMLVGWMCLISSRGLKATLNIQGERDPSAWFPDARRSGPRSVHQRSVPSYILDIYSAFTVLESSEDPPQQELSIGVRPAAYVQPQWRRRWVLNFNGNADSSSAHLELVFTLQNPEQEERNHGSIHASVCHLDQNVCNHVYGARRHFGAHSRHWDVFNVTVLLQRLSNNITLHVDIFGPTVSYELTGIDRPSLVYWSSASQAELLFSVEPERVHRRRRALENDELEPPRNDTGTNETAKSEDVGDHCRLHPWNMDFVDVEWDWVLLPRKFLSNYCAGVCPENLDKMVTSNHALLRHETRRVTRGANATVPPACCAPARLGGQSFLYFTANHDIILRQMIETVVQKCACL